MICNKNNSQKKPLPYAANTLWLETGKQRQSSHDMFEHRDTSTTGSVQQSRDGNKHSERHIPHLTSCSSQQRPQTCHHRRQQWRICCCISTSFNRNLWTFALIVSVIASFSAQIPAVDGLACYETVNGKTTIVQSDSWTYCALVPATVVGNELVNGSQFGLGPENDMLSAYNTAFSMSQEEYRILTVCIYERYDFSRFITIKPDLAVEFAFRCVCNYDLCNSEPTFSAYLSAIKSESFARR